MAMKAKRMAKLGMMLGLGLACASGPRAAAEDGDWSPTRVPSYSARPVSATGPYAPVPPIAVAPTPPAPAVPAPAAPAPAAPAAPPPAPVAPVAQAAPVGPAPHAVP